MARKRAFWLVIGIAAAVLAMPGLWFGFWELYDYREGVVTRNVAHARAHLGEVEIGMTKDQIRKHLGSPSGHENGCWVYGKGWVFRTAVTVVVCFSQDRATSIDLDASGEGAD